MYWYWGKKIFKEYLNLVSEGMIDDLHLYDINSNILTDEIFHGLNVVIHDSYQSLIDAVDAIHICVPNNFHYEYALRSITAGVSTMIEKPLTKDSIEAFNLVELALEYKVVLQVGNIFRFSNSLNIAREMIKNGTIGSINHISLLWTHMAPSDNSKAEDALWDLGPHIFDILNFLTGSWPLSTIYNSNQHYGLSERQYQTELIEDYGNFTSRIRMSLIDHRKARIIEISGTLGTVIIDPVNQKIDFYSDKGMSHVEVEKNNTLRDEILNFIECSKSGRTRINSGNLGAAIVRILENIEEVPKNETKS